MDANRKIEVLETQIQNAKGGFPDDFEAWRASTDVALRSVLGDNAPLYSDFKRVRYSSAVYYAGMDTSGYRPGGVRKVIALLEAAKQEVELRAELEAVVTTDETPEERAQAAESGRVFIVHGHDEAKKYELAALVLSLTGTKAIILHEQPDQGRTIIEKLEHYGANAGFAIALLTADDLGRAKADGSAEHPRARQNVVFEAGYFAGRLGRSRVTLLHEPGVEVPGDLDGVVYVPIDSGKAWRVKLAFELKSAGIPVDLEGLAGS